jgi:tetratricopeptide (TPR) repeat protein
MLCPKCGKEASGKFCNECGAQLPQVRKCPDCGAEQPMTAKFCNECGASFEEKKSKKKKTTIQGSQINVGDVGYFEGTITATTNVDQRDYSTHIHVEKLEMRGEVSREEIAALNGKIDQLYKIIPQTIDLGAKIELTSQQKKLVEEVGESFDNIEKKAGESIADADTYIRLGNADKLTGKPKDALAKYEMAQKLYEKEQDKKGIVVCLNQIGLIYDLWGNYDKALRYLEKSLAISEELGDKKGISAIYNNIGIIYSNRGK